VSFSRFWDAKACCFCSSSRHRSPRWSYGDDSLRYNMLRI
jgi:hypothetical protein